MAVYVYTVADGSLYSWAPNDDDPVASDDDLAAAGRAAVRDLPALDDTHAWDAATHSVIVVIAPVKPDLIPTFDFVLLFTAAETAAIRASADLNVQHLLFALTMAQQIDRTNATITGGIAYLASVGLLTQDRATQILTGPIA